MENISQLLKENYDLIVVRQNILRPIINITTDGLELVGWGRLVKIEGEKGINSPHTHKMWYSVELVLERMVDDLPPFWVHRLVALEREVIVMCDGERPETFEFKGYLLAYNRVSDEELERVKEYLDVNVSYRCHDYIILGRDIGAKKGWDWEKINDGGISVIDGNMLWYLKIKKDFITNAECDIWRDEDEQEGG